MEIEEDLKALILKRFKSIRAFAIAIDKPCSSVNNIFSRGVRGAGISTVIPMCRALNIDVDSLADGKIVFKNSTIPLTSDEEELLSYYHDFNKNGKNEALKRLKEMSKLDEYKKCSDFELEQKQA